ncbi:MAG: aminopeptidase P N-terminal domain-containing protein [Planctomycetes bacterium]|nr:aminopeptidase P N-terminal domain-containing protein [Planctomycetota bacterium]
MSRDANPDQALHAARRQRALDALGDGLLILPTAVESPRNGDVLHDYRPGSDFHFLTGFPEPEAVLLASRRGRGRHHSVLFVRPRDREREIWDGRRHGVAGARRRFGVDEAFEIGSFWRELPRFLAPHARVFHRLGADPAFDRRLFEVFAGEARRHRRQAPPAHPVLQDPLPALAAMRLVKDSAEQRALHAAAAVTVAGHVAAMQAARPGLHEYEVQAVLEAEFRRRGSVRNGYPSIVASGPNACVLHYHDNDRRLRPGDLLLIDAGAELQGCTADVTRTFPVAGRFTPAQAAVYRVVLRAQLAGIAACRAGAPWDAAHRVCVRWLTRGLVELGVLRGDVRALVRGQRFKPFYMHGTSHWLGRDVHDVGAYQDDAGRAAVLRPGMVLTVEPGLYFAAGDRRVPAELRGIGIRIEDDVLVTRGTPQVLTAAAPKELEAVERACGRQPGRAAVRRKARAQPGS